VRAPDAVLLVDGKRIALGSRGAILGRSRNCDIVLADANISRQHAEVRLRGDAWTIADLGSTNGVLVNGQNVRTEHRLSGGDQIELGTSRLIFELA
jgi:pSer/pThr/pTyr-binding forkhead associated (FHA) protein